MNLREKTTKSNKNIEIVIVAPRKLLYVVSPSIEKVLVSPKISALFVSARSLCPEDFGFLYFILFLKININT